MLLAGSEALTISEDGAIELPDYLSEWLGGGELAYEKDNLGIVVSIKKIDNEII